MNTTRVSACKTRTSLRRVCSLAKSDHTRALKLLHQRLQSEQDCDLIRSYVDKTNELAKQARVALERHLAEHGCQAADDHKDLVQWA